MRHAGGRLAYPEAVFLSIYRSRGIPKQCKGSGHGSWDTIWRSRRSANMQDTKSGGPNIKLQKLSTVGRACHRFYVRRHNWGLYSQVSSFMSSTQLYSGLLLKYMHLSGSICTQIPAMLSQRPFDSRHCILLYLRPPHYRLSSTCVNLSAP